MNDKEQRITVEFVLGLLSSRLKIDRERGIIKLEKLLKSWEKPVDEIIKAESIVGKKQLQSEVLEGLIQEEPVESRPSSSADQQKLESTSRPISRQSSLSEEQQQWEKKHGYLMACYPLIAMSGKDDQEFLLKIRDISILLITHEEVRVQLAAGGVLGFISKYLGPSVYETSREIILNLITENLTNVCIISEDEELKSVEQGFDVNLPAHVIRDKVIRESQGWKNLEPSLKCLQFMIENLECEFVPFMEPRLSKLIFQCLSHPVRYVREVGFQIFTALIVAAPEDVKEFAHQLSQCLAIGLSDNWNQVRIAAAITTRRLLLTYSESKEEFYPVLLPKLCLNRYYKSEGIRTYSQDSWRLIVGTEGRNLVAKYMDDIVKCYLSSTTSTNLAEREAACACISELATKIDQTAFLPHVIPLLEALISCTENESWSVRDAACLACGSFIMEHPTISKPYLEGLYKILFRNLGDPIQLLRQGAATTLGNIATAYGIETLGIILPKLIEGLTTVGSMKHQFTSISTHINPSSHAVTSTTLDGNHGHGHLVADEGACVQHDPQCEFAVPGKILVTSESLMRFLEGSTSSSTTTSNLHHIQSHCLCCRKSKLPQPWHLTDGSIYLVGTLTSVSEYKKDIENLIPLMLQATQEKSYLDHYIIHETFCKILPLVAKAIGKRTFKESLQDLFEPIFYTIESVNPMTSGIGKNCLGELAEFLGPNILRSRVELYNPRFIHYVPEVRIQ